MTIKYNYHTIPMTVIFMKLDEDHKTKNSSILVFRYIFMAKFPCKINISGLLMKITTTSSL